MKNLTKKTGIIAIGAVILFGLILAGCATTIPTYTVKSPTIDTKDVQKLQIKDFENKSGVGGSDLVQITRYLSEQSAGIVRGANFFTIVNDANAEGIFTGEVRVYNSKDSSGQIQQYNLVTKTTETVTQYKREVQLEFAYSIINTRTNVEIGKVVKSGSRTETSTVAASQLPNSLTLAQRIVDDKLRELKADVVPTLVVASRDKLFTQKTKNKNLKEAMKLADTLVKNNKYEQALAKYNEIIEKYPDENDAARENATLLKNAIASNAAANAKLAALYDDKDGVAEKAVKSAAAALDAKLAAGTNLMIMKQSSAEANMLDYVVNNLTKGLIDGGKLKVIDRSNQALIDAEQKFQLSGKVDDASTISVGKQLGVRYAVMLSITGVSSERKLNVKVLDIQSSAVIVQEAFDI